MTTAGEAQVRTFSYVAVASDGEPIRGTIDAEDAGQASRRLGALHFQVMELTAAPRQRVSPLRGDDFAAFNQQLAQLAGAGLPVEEGLRLIAEDMRKGRLARTLRQVADQLESGKTLPQAIDANRAGFPPLYARLMDAGIRSGNLQGTLLNLGRHLTLVRQLRSALWRTAAYPLMVLAAALGMLVFIAFVLIPQLEPTFRDFHVRLPYLTEFVLSIAATIRSGMFWMVVGVLLVGSIVVWLMLRATGKDRAFMGRLGLLLPLIAPVLRRSLIARWCDAARLGIEAGLDLPESIKLAGDVVDSSELRSDGVGLIQRLAAGGVGGVEARGLLLPLAVVRTIQIAGQRNDLAATLGMLSEMYENQARARLETLQGILAPLLLIFVGLVISFMALSLLAPLISLITSMTGPASYKHH